MSHFRPKRQVRRVVDCLSLILATPIFAQRGVISLPVTGFPQYPPRRRRTIPLHRLLFWRDRLRQVRFRLGSPRLIGLLGVLIVCSVGLSEADLTTDSAVTAASSRGADVMQAVVRSEQRLAFYDPADTPAVAAATALAGIEIPLPVRSTPLEAKPLPWAIPESVFFLYKADKAGAPGTGRTPIATAFVLNVPERKRGGFVRFLVTARHVVDPQWAHCSETNPASIDLRLNRWAGGTDYASISLQTGHRPRFFTPADPTVDLAAVPLDRILIPNLNEYKFIDVPFRLLPTNTEALQFHADQPVMTARLPPGRPGRSSNFPVFDSGLLASVAAGAIDVQCGPTQSAQSASTPLHVWFISASVPQGTSGAPVYTSVARGTEGTKTPVLLGIQSVAWPDRGLAGITPAIALRDMIQSALAQNRAGMDFYQGPIAAGTFLGEPVPGWPWASSANAGTAVTPARRRRLPVGIPEL